MQVFIQTDRHIALTEKQRERFEQDLTKAVGHFDARLTRIEAHLSDVNSARGGDNDKRCLLEAPRAASRSPSTTRRRRSNWPSRGPAANSSAPWKAPSAAWPARAARMAASPRSTKRVPLAIRRLHRGSGANDGKRSYAGHRRGSTATRRKSPFIDHPLQQGDVAGTSIDASR